MATEEELGRQVREEIAKLEDAWSRLFVVDGVNGEQTDAKLGEDTFHTPPALRYFVNDIISEVCNNINARISLFVERGELEPGSEAFDYAMNAFATMMRMVTCRVYLIGQDLHKDLPYHSLTQCRCKSLVDDEIEQLLSGPFNLEGDGFLILNFDTSKATKQTGKAHWLRR